MTLARTELRARVTSCRPRRLGSWGAALVKAIADKGEVESTGCLAVVVPGRRGAIDTGEHGLLGWSGCADAWLPSMGRGTGAWLVRGGRGCGCR